MRMENLYFFSTLEIAYSFISSIDASQLSIEPAEFDAQLAAASARRAALRSSKKRSVRGLFGTWRGKNRANSTAATAASTGANKAGD